jgi:hypothetical protein
VAGTSRRRRVEPEFSGGSLCGARGTPKTRVARHFKEPCGRPRGRNASPSNLTNVGGTLYFTASNPPYGTELWKYTPDDVVAPPAVTSIAVGDGTAQRSQVKKLTVAFDRAVTLQAGAFKLVRLNTGGSGVNNGSAPTDASSFFRSCTGSMKRRWRICPNTKTPTAKNAVSNETVSCGQVISRSSGSGRIV